MRAFELGGGTSMATCAGASGPCGVGERVPQDIALGEAILQELQERLRRQWQSPPLHVAATDPASCEFRRTPRLACAARCAVSEATTPPAASDGGDEDDDVDCLSGHGADTLSTAGSIGTAPPSPLDACAAGRAAVRMGGGTESGACVLQLSEALSDAPLPPPCASVGSAGHYAGCCRPCDFISRGHCRFGVACSFCHICTPGERKQQKLLRKKMARVIRRAPWTPASV
mmetsp:Transcript_70301/g.197111  ORF Transcript_70301/g.197111 Transcript_70301/m.197111 type:complete len:229 (-) Transcript_70301:144-830(-)